MNILERLANESFLTSLDLNDAKEAFLTRCVRNELELISTSAILAIEAVYNSRNLGEWEMYTDRMLADMANSYAQAAMTLLEDIDPFLTQMDRLISKTQLFLGRQVKARCAEIGLELV